MRRVAPGVLILRLALVLLGLSAAGAHAESYPSRPVRVIVTAAAGGTTDFLARWIGKGFTEQTGQPLIVENRGGTRGAVRGELFFSSTPRPSPLATDGASAHPPLPLVCPAKARR